MSVMGIVGIIDVDMVSGEIFCQQVINDSFDSLVVFFQCFVVGVVVQCFCLWCIEEVIGYQVDVIQVGSYQIFYFCIVKNSSDSRSGNRDFYIVQISGIQLFMQFGNQQCVVSVIFWIKWVVCFFIVWVFLVNIYFVEYWELFEQFYYVFGEDFMRRVRSGGFVEFVIYVLVVDIYGECQCVICGFCFCLYIMQCVQQIFGVRLSYSFWIYILVVDIKVEVDIRLEVVLWVEEGWFIFYFVVQCCCFCYDIVVFCINFFEIGDVNKVKNQFVISCW